MIIENAKNVGKGGVQYAKGNRDGKWYKLTEDDLDYNTGFAFTEQELRDEIDAMAEVLGARKVTLWNAI
jgi:hypothetical protein